MTESAVAMQPKTSPDSESKSRTGIHILGAFVIAVFMAVALALSPYMVGRRNADHLVDLQRAARGDLLYLARAENEFKAKHGFFTTDFNALMITPKVVIYKFGFAQPASAELAQGFTAFTVRPELKDLDALKAAIPQLQIEFSPVTKISSIDFNEVARICADCTATRESFKALAVANLDEDATLDIWTLDEKGGFRHLVNDLAAETAH